MKKGRASAYSVYKHLSECCGRRLLTLQSEVVPTRIELR